MNRKHIRHLIWRLTSSYRTLLVWQHGGRHRGVTVSLQYRKPTFERCGDEWYAQGFGVCLWSHIPHFQTVGERGVW